MIFQCPFFPFFASRPFWSANAMLLGIFFCCPALLAKQALGSLWLTFLRAFLSQNVESGGDSFSPCRFLSFLSFPFFASSFFRVIYYNWSLFSLSAYPFLSCWPDRFHYSRSILALNEQRCDWLLNPSRSHFALCSAVSWLDISSSDLKSCTSEHITVLVSCLNSFRHLEHLSLAHNDFDDHQMTVLLPSLAKLPLRFLDLSGKRLSVSGSREGFITLVRTLFPLSHPSRAYSSWCSHFSFHYRSFSSEWAWIGSRTAEAKSKCGPFQFFLGRFNSFTEAPSVGSL